MKVLLLSFVPLLAFACSNTTGVTAEGSTDPKHLTGRIWVEREPQNPRDPVRHMLLMELDDGQRGGADGHMSSFRFDLDLFLWSTATKENKATVQMVFPQTDTTLTAQWHVKDCKEGPYDLCLYLTTPQGTQRMLGMKKQQLPPPRFNELSTLIRTAVNESRF